MKKSLAFIDLLGFSNMVKKDHSKAKEVLNDFYNISFQEIEGCSEIEGMLVSDSLIAYSENNSALLNSLCSIYRKCLEKNGEYCDNALCDFFLLPRGGFSIGEVNVEERTEAPNVRKGFIVSPALVHSSKMEQSIKGSRLLIAVNDLNGEDIDFHWNTETRAILYSDDSYRLYEKYSYNDALWFADLNKNYNDQKEEIKKLIEVAILLVKANVKNPRALEQHIGTLRIGLLSYSKHCEVVTDDMIIKRILDEFKEDKYWLVWVSVLEMVLQSPDGSIASLNSRIVEFYREMCLSVGWKKVIEYSNKKDNVHFKKLLQEYIGSMRF